MLKRKKRKREHTHTWINKLWCFFIICYFYVDGVNFNMFVQSILINCLRFIGMWRFFPARSLACLDIYEILLNLKLWKREKWWNGSETYYDCTKRKIKCEHCLFARSFDNHTYRHRWCRWSISMYLNENHDFYLRTPIPLRLNRFLQRKPFLCQAIVAACLLLFLLKFFFFFWFFLLFFFDIFLWMSVFFC